jgi:hypothetical protein
MTDLRLILVTAFWICVAAIPIVSIALAFLHAARVPQWVWAFSSRTQVVWLAGLLVGIAVVPLGLPLAGWYVFKIRPQLASIERGDMSWKEDPPA